MPFEQLRSPEGRVVFGGVLVMILAFPPIFLGDEPGASVRRAFLWSTAVGVVVTWCAVLVTSRPRPGGRPPAPPPASTAGLAGIAIFLIAVVPVPFLAVLAGLGEGFFIACELLWLTDLFRLRRWRRSRRAVDFPS